MQIISYAFDGEGMGPVYKNDQWMVGIKNFKPANAKENMDSLERHNETDELFVLIEGTCTLIYANETEKGLDFGSVVMERGKVYSIPATLWHNTVTIPETKMILIEKPGTCADNSDFLTLTEGQKEALRAVC